MIIQVTQEDIDNGKPNTSTWCPVALALQRVLGDKSIFVDYNYAESCNCSEFPVLSRVITPAKARNFIRRYDRGEKVEPFEFELDIPEKKGKLTNDYQKDY